MNFDQAAQLIESAANILITTHVRPDGDAIGSAGALKRIIRQNAQRRQKNCTVEAFFLSNIPDNYQFLLTEPSLIMGQQIDQEQINTGQLDRFDLIIVLDTNSKQQLPSIADYLTARSAPVLVIDHHLGEAALGSHHLINQDAAATGQIVFDLACHARWTIDQTAAADLFAALATDTGWFRFQNASASAYACASKLIHAGAIPNQLYRQLFESFPPERLTLLAMTLATLELHCDDRLAIMHITNDMLAQSRAKRSHIENIINESQQIASVIVSVLLVEQDDATTRASFRSLGPLDVNAIATQFNGGGHAKAAGATLNIPLTQARQNIIKAITPQMPPNP